MSRPAFDLAGSSALVTGAASGIGRATAQALAASGARVACTDVPGRGPLLTSVVQAIRDEGGVAIEASLDVTASVAIPGIVDRLAEEMGGLHILVNNAGTQLMKPALEFDEGEWDQILSVNLKGAFFCAQAVAGLMIDQGGGVIVNVASQHGVVGNVLRAPYCASKAGLINLTRALAVEWAPNGIRVNAVSPTFVDNGSNTEMLQQPAMQADMDNNLPLRRAAMPDEVAAGIVYLVSPAAAMVTGHNLMIDGGWTSR